MQKKTKVIVLFGGKSAEHEVSINSARSVLSAIDRNKYEAIPVYIGREGRWLLGKGPDLLGNGESREIKDIREIGLASLSGRSGEVKGIGKEEVVVFHLIHGTLGEDGTMQGFLRILNLPFVGADVLGSAVGMDKEITKRLLKEAGIKVGRFRVVRGVGEVSEIGESRVIEELGLPLFVKPANAGSSVGVSKVKNEKELLPAIKKAFQFDDKVLLEENIIGREIECSVLGNEDPKASLPGEIIVHDEFYTYEAKYADGKTELKIPAELPKKVVKKVQVLAVETFKTLCCQGLARVDFFLRGEDELLVNEINTIPGFTDHSMYPKLWEATGLSYPDLIDQLIQLALERHSKQQKLQFIR